VGPIPQSCEWPSRIRVLNLDQSLNQRQCEQVANLLGNRRLVSPCSPVSTCGSTDEDLAVPIFLISFSIQP
jgi:hypothetical protein